MRIKDILAEKSTDMSFELFPPKQAENLENTCDVVQSMAELAPSFMSITCGAMGTTAGLTLELAQYVKSQGVEALAHLTCVAATKQSVADSAKRLSEAGVENILALRGDIPAESDVRPLSDFHYASELVSELKKHGDFCIGGACYPEGHVESPNRDKDVDNLKYKVEAGCDFLITQLFFDNGVMYRFLYKLYSKGINVPVMAGIMPITSKKQIERTVKLSGTALPPRFVTLLDRFGDEPKAMRQAGIIYATEQISDLVANGVNSIHLYTMNRPDVTAEIRRNLSDIVG